MRRPVYVQFRMAPYAREGLASLRMALEHERFANRTAAGRALAGGVRNLKLQPPILVLGLPRGGVQVAYEVASALRAPLDVLVVREIGLPGRPELALGAIASGGVMVRGADSVARLAGFDADFEQLAKRERAELERREHAYRRGLPPLNLEGQTVVLVDDGLATGCTMVAAVRAARKAGAAFVVVAAPVASDEAVAHIGGVAGALVILKITPSLFSISTWYEDFETIEDAEVRDLLKRARNTPLEAVPRAKGAA